MSTKRHPILTQIRSLQTTERRWLWVYFGSLYLSLVLTVFAILCGIDYWLRNESQLFRGISSGILLLTFAGGGFRLIWPLFRKRQDTVSFAKRLESIKPELQGQLSLAVDFLTGNKTNGSDALRDQTIQQAEKRVRDQLAVPPVKTDWPVRTAILFLTVGMLVGLVFVMVPQESRIAAHRLLNPFQPTAWPAFNSLHLLEVPPKVATGVNLRVRVQDEKQRLPAKVILEIDDGHRIRRREMRRLSGEMIFSIENIQRSFRMRAIGGDSITNWYSVEVVDPPTVDQLEIDIQPPAYSGLPDRTTPAFRKVWKGSKIRIRGTAHRPFATAAVLFTESDRAFDCQTIGNRFQFPSAEWMDLSDTAEFRLELTDHDGLVGGKNRLFRIPIRIDEAPYTEVRITHPRTYYSTEDVVPLVISASDDMKIQFLGFQIELGGEWQPVQSLPIAGRLPKAAYELEAAEVEIPINLKLRDLPDIDDDSVVRVQSIARDSKGSVIQSEAIEIRMGSPEDLLRMKRHESVRIIDMVRSSLESQIESNNQCRLVQLSLSGNENASPNTRVTRLQRATELQRRVESLLFAEEGAVALCDRFLGSYSRSDESGQIEHLRKSVMGLKSITAKTTDLLGNSLDSLRLNPESRDLDQAINSQQQIIEVLRKLTGDIDMLARQQSVLFELGRIRDREITIRKQMHEVRKLAFNTNRDEDTQVQSSRLVNQQKSIADELQEIHFGLQRDLLEHPSPGLAHLSDISKRSEILAKQSASQLSKNQFGLAIQSVDSLIEILGESVKPARKTPSSSATESAVKHSIERIGSIQSETRKITDAISNWNTLTPAEKQALRDRLSLQRNALQEQFESSRPYLSPESESLFRETLDLMSDATHSLKENQPIPANEKLLNAVGKLDQIKKKLDSKLNNIRRLDRTERFRQIQIRLRGALDSQKAIHQTLRSLPTPIDNSPGTLKECSVNQQKLSEIYRSAFTDSHDLFVLETRLKTICKISEDAVSHLDQNEAQTAIRSIATLLEHLTNITSVESDESRKSDDSQGRSNQKGSQDTQSAPKLDITELEVQMLRLIQEEILNETRDLEKLQDEQPNPRVSAEIKARSTGLAAKQSELIQALEHYIQRPDNTKGQKLDKKIPNIPNIPEIDNIPDPNDGCGFTMNDHEAFDQPEQEQEKSRTNQSTRPNIGSTNPFIPEGEDIGVDSADARHRLSSIRKKMAKIKEMIERQEFSQDSQTLQSEVLEELDIFNTDKKKQSSGDDSSQQDPQKQSGSEAANNSNSKSNDNTGSPRNPKNQGGRKIQKRIDEIWGHLPAIIRQPELSIQSDSYLPKFKKQIAEYFKRLADE